jgi:hypothetical protein
MRSEWLKLTSDVHTYALCAFHGKTCQVWEIMAGLGQRLSELSIGLSWLVWAAMQQERHACRFERSTQPIRACLTTLAYLYWAFTRSSSVWYPRRNCRETELMENDTNVMESYEDGWVGLTQKVGMLWVAPRPQEDEPNQTSKWMMWWASEF